MRLLFLLYLFIPFTLAAQKDEIFATFINENGALIQGSSLTQFYERQIQAYNIETNPEGNRITILFTMKNENAVNVLRDRMLKNAVIPVVPLPFN